MTRITGDRVPGSRGQKQARRWRMDDRCRGEGTLAKEWDALNSGLLKQLFDRHYTLACGWCQCLLAVRCRKKRVTRCVRRNKETVQDLPGNFPEKSSAQRAPWQSLQLLNVAFARARKKQGRSKEENEGKRRYVSGFRPSALLSAANTGHESARIPKFRRGWVKKEKGHLLRIVGPGSTLPPRSLLSG